MLCERLKGRRERCGVPRVAPPVGDGRAPLVRPSVLQDVEGGGAEVHTAPPPHCAERNQGWNRQCCLSSWKNREGDTDHTVDTGVTLVIAALVLYIEK